jgi:type I restriction enzyme M protein
MGKVQLIDATSIFTQLRKNMGKKNCQFSASQIDQVMDLFLKFEESEHSKIFPNAAFGYWKVTVERPLRIPGLDPEKVYKSADLKKLRAERGTSPDAPPVLRKLHKDGRREFEPDADLRDTEQIPLLETGGINAFIDREVLPHVPDAWVDPDKTQIGYEISFTRHFYKPAPLRTLAEIKADLDSLQDEAEGLLDAIISPSSAQMP